MKAHIEFGVQEKIEDTDRWYDFADAYPDYKSARAAVNGMEHFRVVKRAVTDWEVVE
ncbi:hypothetical protein [Corynebacterium kalidii]